MASETRFSRLADLAHERSSDKRRELLREVTDLFFDRNGKRSLDEDRLFDDIMSSVAAEMDFEVRVELANRLTKSPGGPRRLSRQLAMDQIEVAAPVLRTSQTLEDEDLVDIARVQGQDHLVAISGRDRVSATVSGVLVERGDDRVVSALLRNRNARLSRTSFEQIADRVADSAVLQAPFVERRDAPLDLLNEVFGSVERDLREKIRARNEAASAEEVEAALAIARTKVAKARGALPEDYDAALVFVERRAKDNALDGPLLVNVLREKRVTHFKAALAHMTGVDFLTVHLFWEKKDLDGLATICRAGGIERAVFVTIAVLLAGGANGLGQAEIYGRLYQSVPQEAAQRAIRFWRVRKSGTEPRNAA